MQGTPSPYPHPPQPGGMPPGMGQPPGLPESFSQNPVGVEIGFWPIAWGWWGLLALSIMLVIALVVGLRAWRRHRVFLRMALRELSELDLNESNIKSQCNQILKRTFMSYYPVEKIAKLHGDGWQAFLKNQLSDKKQMVLKPLLDSLGNDFYRTGVANENMANNEYVESSIALLKHSLPPSKKQREQLDIGGNQ